MNTKIMKWGNSLALRIPKSFAQAINLEEGNDVRIKIEKDNLIVKKAKNKKYDLKSLLAGINKNNLHGETDTGNSVGKEVW
ncbi:MAG: AbrB/MazE/SpoVT family DNA-binding domain-containing protein [Ignavibacteria bacterium]|nr:AbrB/MazE/SpoVT family DNA-binding domain-containing protein [Ignavibacteria bacterium]